jgi:intein/homing endonuclease
LYGYPGTGKSFCAVGIGLQMLMQDKIEQLIFTRPYVEAGESLGFLPGNYNSKIAPFMYPVMEIASHFIGSEAVSAFIDKGNIRVIPFAYMRGCTFQNSFIVADECLSPNTKIISKINGKENDRSIKNIVENYESNNNVEVLSLNTNTGNTEWKKVTSIFKNKDKEIIDINLNIRKYPIKCTKNHPFAVWENNNITWKPADQLNIGDIVLRNPKGKNNGYLLKNSELDILAGFILGDGCITKNVSKMESYRLTKNHGLKQYKYQELCKKLFLGHKNGAISGYTGKPICGFTSKSFGLSKNFLNAFFDNNGKKIITKNIEQWLSPRALALWYMDDGSLNIEKTGFYVSLHTEGFTLNENNILSTILKEKYNIDSKVSTYNKRGNILYYLRLNKDNSNKFINFIKDYVPLCMQYKIPENYRNLNAKMTECEDVFVKLSYSYVTSISNTSEISDTYNIEVQDNNNYFADNILVHNCQNSTPSQMRLLLTRLGDKSQLVITGDTEQSDLHLKTNGLVDCINRLKDVPEIGFCELGEECCVRSPLVAKIDKIYRGK